MNWFCEALPQHPPTHTHWNGVQNPSVNKYGVWSRQSTTKRSDHCSSTPVVMHSRMPTSSKHCFHNKNSFVQLFPAWESYFLSTLFPPMGVALWVSRLCKKKKNWLLAGKANIKYWKKSGLISKKTQYCPINCVILPHHSVTFMPWRCIHSNDVTLSPNFRW